MSFNAVIFDLDGTLLDTLRDLANSYNRVLNKIGCPPHSIQSYRDFVGNGSKVCMTRALPVECRDDDTILYCLQLFRDDYAKNWDIFTKPYPGIPHLLTTISALDIPMAILSNKPHEDTMRCVNKYLSRWEFRCIFGQTDTMPIKPDPSRALEISQLIGVSPAGVLFVGDTPVDMETALSAGMFPVGVLWGFRSHTELIQSGATSTIKTPLDLIPLIDS